MHLSQLPAWLRTVLGSRSALFSSRKTHKQQRTSVVQRLSAAVGRVAIRLAAGCKRQWHELTRSMIQAILPRFESLEGRQYLSWIGATSGTTNDAAHDYNNTANWAGGVIDDSFNGVTFTADTTLYLSANRTTGVAGLNLGYSGDYNLRFKSNSSTARTLFLGGSISGDFGGSSNNRTVTLGEASAPLNITLNGTTRTFTIASGDNLLVQNTISSGSVSKQGGGTLGLQAAGAFSGSTLTVWGGEVTEAAGNAITGTANLTVQNGGTVTLSASNNHTGATQLYSGGILNLQAAGAISNSTLSIYGGTLNQTTANALSGSAKLLLQSGFTGQVTLAYANNFTGGTTVNAGTLTLQAGGALSTGLVRINDGTLDLQVAGALNGNTLTFYGGGLSQSVANAITGSSKFQLASTYVGPLTLAYANNYSGGTLINGGTLNVQASGALGTGVVTINAGTVNLQAAGASGGNFSVSGGSLNLQTAGAVNATAVYLYADAALTQTVPNALSGTARLQLASTFVGPLTLSYPNNYTNGTFIYGGTLLADNTNGSATGSGMVTVYSTGTFGALSPMDQAFLSRVSTTSTGVIALAADSSQNLSFASFANARLGAVGAATYSGTLTPNGNMYRLGGGGGTLIVNSVLSNGGSTRGVEIGLNGTAPGTVVLAAANTYTGATTVNGGMLLVDGSIPAANTVTVNADSTLGGTGSIGAVTIQGSGLLSPGDPATAPGVLNTQNLSLISGSTFRADVNGDTAGSGYDQIRVTGSVNLGGAALSLLGLGVPTAGVLTLIANDGSDPVTGTFAGLADGDSVTLNGVSYTIHYFGGDGNDVTLIGPPLYLSVSGISDTQKTSVGGYLPLNDDFDEASSDSRGNPVPDNLADMAPGQPILATDSDLRDATLWLDGTPGSWSLSFPDNIAVWRETTPGVYSRVSSGVSERVAGGAQLIHLKIEGLERSMAERDVALTAMFQPDDMSLPQFQDVVCLTVAAVDLDIDSDNNNRYDQPGHTFTEERLEQDAANPGKVLYVNDNDSDADGIIDYADFSTTGERFVPVSVRTTDPYNLTTARFRLTYDASDPAAFSGGTPAPGTLRLWTKPGDQSRLPASASSGGNYVGPGTYTAAELGFDTNDEAILWLEAVAPTAGESSRLIRIEVDPDGAGPLGFELSDSVYVTAEHTAVLPGSVSGYKWEDLNSNGIRDQQLIQGTPPDIIFVVDVSGSTIDRFRYNDPTNAPGDVNGDGRSNTILDAELAGFLKLTQYLRDHGFQNSAKIGVVVFAQTATYLDMDPALAGVQLYSSPNASTDQILSHLQIGHAGVGNSTNYQAGLVQATAVFRQIDPTGEHTNIVFLSDGYPNVPGTGHSWYTTEATILRNLGAHVRAFGAGLGASLSPLQWIDPAAAIFTNADQVLGAFSNLDPDKIVFSEPGLSGWRIYADVNGNEQFDAGEPSTITGADGTYTITGLPPGQYAIREQMQSGWSQTAPSGGMYTVTVVADQDVADINFGNHYNPSVDLDIDSDNDNSMAAPDRSTDEDQIEGNPRLPGKLLYVNSGDADADGVPDYADLNVPGGGSFTPLVLDLAQFSDLTPARISFTYAGSDPAAISGHNPAPGFLRIWTKNNDQARAVADYVKPGQSYSPSQLGLSNSNKTITLWVEAIAITTEDTQRLIRVDVDPDGPGPTNIELYDAVYITVENQPPVVDDQSFDVAENSANGTVVGTILAQESDRGQSLSYAILSGNESGAFSLDPHTGILTVADGTKLNYETTASYTLVVQVTDDGTPALSDTAAATINLANVNEAPINTVPGTQFANEYMDLEFSTSKGNQISIWDEDAGTDSVEVTLIAANGVLTLATVSGLSFRPGAGDGVADTSMTFTGSISAINTAMNGLIFTPAPNYSDWASIQITTNDQGHNGSGGALSDTDKVDISWPTLGVLSGYVFHDRNRNGIWDGKLIAGAKPDVVFVMDVSGSTEGIFQGTAVGDPNEDGLANTILDAEIAAFTTLNQTLIDLGYADSARVTVVAFDNDVYPLDFDPATAGAQTFTTPTADLDGDGVYDVINYLRSFVPLWGTEYGPALESAQSRLQQMQTTYGNANIFFLSDGAPFTMDYDPLVAALRQQYGANLRAFGVGRGAQAGPLQIIDPNAAIFTTTNELLGAFGTLSGDQQPEEALAGKRVYVDLNNNGLYDADIDPSTLTGADGSYQIANLSLTTARVALVSEIDWQQTYPTTPNAYHELDLAQVRRADSVNFGAVETGPAPTAQIAISGSLREGSPVVITVAAPAGLGPFTYSFDLNGDGDFDDQADLKNTRVNVANFVPTDGPGQYIVKVRISDLVGLYTDSDVVIDATNVVPQVYLGGVPDEVDLDLLQLLEIPAKFDLQGLINDPSSVDRQQGLTYEWSITRDGQPFLQRTGSTTAGTTTQSFEPTGPGTYIITLRATDKDGGQGQASKTVHVVTTAPRITSGPEASSVFITGEITELSVFAQDDGGPENLAYVWSASGPGEVVFSNNESADAAHTTARFSKAGTYQFTVTVWDTTGRSTISDPLEVVVQQTASSIILDPRVTAVNPAEDETFQATVLDQFGDEITSPTVTWSLLTNQSGGSITGNGSTATYTAGTSPGSDLVDVVQATAGDVSITAQVSVGGEVIIGAASRYVVGEGQPLPGDGGIAGFVDPESGHVAGDYQITIDWKDGSNDPSYTLQPFTLANGMMAWEVLADHTYASTGAYNFTVTVSRSGITPVVLTGAAEVQDAPLTAQGNRILPVANVKATYTVATFTDANPLSDVSHFTARIDWGNGQVSEPGDTTIVRNGDVYTVSGDVTYTSTGQRDVTVTIFEDGRERGTVHGVAQVSNTIAPIAPELHAVGISTSQIYLWWEEDPEAYGYIIWATPTSSAGGTSAGVRRRIPSDSTQFINPQPAPSPENPPPAGHARRVFRVDADLPTGSGFTYTIQAVYDGGRLVSQESAPVWASTAGLPEVPAPANLMGKHQSSFDDQTHQQVQSIDVNWDVDPNVDGYKVFRRLLGEPGNGQDLVGQDAGGQEVYLVPDLASTDGRMHWIDKTISFGGPVTAYEYTVIAFKAVNGQTDPTPSSPTTIRVWQDTAGPSAPTNVTVASYPQAVQLTWDDRPAGDTDWAGWYVYRTLDANADPNELANWAQLNTSPLAEDLGYNDFTAPIGQVSYYQVRAVDRLGNLSAVSAIVSIRRSRHAQPPAPTGLAWHTNGVGSIRLDWSVVQVIQDNGWAGDSLTGYNVYRKPHAETAWSATPINATPIIGTTFADNGLPNSAEYDYRVTAIDVDGDESRPSDIVQARTGDGIAPATPVLTTAQAASTTAIRLAWHAGAGSPATTAYRVYRSRSANGNFTLVGEYPAEAGGNLLVDDRLAISTSYFYRIVAVDADGDTSAPLWTDAITTQSVPAAPPFLAITSHPAAAAPVVVTANAQVRGIVDDPNNDLRRWELVLRPLSESGTSYDRIIARGDGEMGEAPGTAVDLGTIQATLLPNGLYQLVLKAWEQNQTNTAAPSELPGAMIEVKTDAKLGNFTLPFEDLTIDVPGGEQIVVRRIYDSAQADVLGDFGYGWRMDLSDTNLRTTARAGAHGDRNLPAFRQGDMVYIDVPGLGQQAFQFLPVPIGYDPGNPGSGYLLGVFPYRPQFVPIDGSKSRLELDPSVGEVTLKKDGDEFFSDQTSFGQLGFNPRRPQFGGKYILTLENGARYTINATSGAIEKMVDANGVETNYTNGSAASGASQLQIQRFGDGRIEWIAQQTSAGLRHKITYQYDQATGDLVSVTDELGKVTRFAYDPQRPHYLTTVTDPRGVNVARATYDDAGRLVALINAMNQSGPLQYNGFDGHSGSATVTDPAGNATETIYNAHGNIVREIKAIQDAGGQVTGYQVTVHQYSYVESTDANLRNHMLDSWLFGISNLNKLVWVADYQSFEIDGPDYAGLRYTQAPTTLARRVDYTLFDGSNQSGNGLFQPKSETTLLADGTEHRLVFLDYDAFGHPQRMQETFSQDGNTVTYVTWTLYDANGNLRYSFSPFTPCDALAEGMEFVVNSRGQVTETWRVKCANPADALPVIGQIARIDRISSNSYDGNSRLQSSTDTANVITRYDYDVDGRVKRVSTIKPDTFDWYGNNVPVTADTEYDAKGRVVKVTDSLGKSTETHYDEIGNVLVSIDQFGGKTIHSYDTRGNLVRTLYPDGTETRSVYDEMGRVVWQMDRFAGASTATFDKFSGTLTWTSQDVGTAVVLTHTIYDSLGRVIKTERYRDGRIRIDANAGTTNVFETSLDTAGTKISQTSTVYNANGQVAETVDASGLRTGHFYYPNGQLMFTGVLKGGADVTWFDTSDPEQAKLAFRTRNGHVLITTYRYDQVDAIGRYDAVTDALGLTIRTYRDAQGRSIRVVKDNGTPADTSDDVTTRTIYSIGGEAIASSLVPPPVGATPEDVFPAGPIGREVVQIDELGQVSYRLYDNLGRLTDVWLAAVDDAAVAGTSLVNPHWHYTHRSDGLELSQRDPLGRTTGFEYDNLGRRTGRVLADGSRESWTYDEFGRVKTHIDFGGQVTRYVYDDNVSLAAGENRNLGRLVEERRFDSTGAYDNGRGVAAERTHYLYDELGRRREVNEYVGSELTLSTGYEYVPITGNVTRISSSVSGTIHYEYDPATGRLVFTWTNHNETAYEYDRLGRLKHVKALLLNGVRYATRDPEDGTISGTPLTTTYCYDAAGNLDTQTSPNGVKEDYDYDSLNRLTKLTITDAQGDKLFEQDYVLLANGQRDYVVEKRYDGTSSTPFSTVKIDWSYDALGRLVSEVRDEGHDGVQDGGDYSDTYAFDLVGNRISKTHDAVGSANDEIISYAYNIRDQLMAEDSTISANDRTYIYDANGSTTSVTTNGSSVVKYVWDSRNRMIGVDANGDGDTSDAGDITYGYDMGGNRISRVVIGSESTYYLIDTQNPTGYAKAIEEKSSPSDLPTLSYIFGHDIIAQSDVTSGTLYLVKDGHGTTRALANTSGSVIERYDFDAYGNKVSYTDAMGSPLSGEPLTVWLMADGYRDPTTHFDRNGVRDVAGYIGRMWSSDPWSGNSNDPVTLHKYLYCHGNPINFNDPSGNSFIVDFTIQNGIRGLIAGITLGGINAVWSYAKGATLSESLWGGFRTAAITGAVFVSPLLAWSLLVTTPVTMSLDIYSGALRGTDVPEIASYIGAGVALHLLFKNPAYNVFEVKTVLKMKVPQAVNNLVTGNSVNAARNAQWQQARTTGNKALQGTLVHAELADLMRVQNMSNLKIEVSYDAAGNLTHYGALNSVRLDYEVNVGGRPIKVYDLKPGDIIDGRWINKVSSRLDLSSEDIRAISYGEYLP